MPGVIERGHIYFFYRPRVDLDEVESIDDVQRFHILFIPRPPEFSVGPAPSAEDAKTEESEIILLSNGADAVPAPEPKNTKTKQFRFVSLGKKSLPDPEADGGGGGGGGRKEMFWGVVTTVGEDLEKLADGLGPKQYETKTKGETALVYMGSHGNLLTVRSGTRYQGPARLAARGAYAFVNNEQVPTPSKRETHLGYYLSHPTSDNLGELHTELGIHIASSFVVQVKNPLAPPTGPGRIGLPPNKRAEYPEEIITEVFGKGGMRGQGDFGLRFVSVERKELLDYEGAELLFIAARSGEEGLEKSLGEGRGEGESTNILDLAGEHVEMIHPFSFEGDRGERKQREYSRSIERAWFGQGGDPCLSSGGFMAVNAAESRTESCTTTWKTGYSYFV